MVPDLRVKMTPDQLEHLGELRTNVDTLPEPGVESREPRKDASEILVTGADPQLETALLALRVRALKQASATAMAGAPGKPAKPGTQTP